MESVQFMIPIFMFLILFVAGGFIEDILHPLFIFSSERFFMSSYNDSSELSVLLENSWVRYNFYQNHHSDGGRMVPF